MQVKIRSTFVPLLCFVQCLFRSLSPTIYWYYQYYLFGCYFWCFEALKLNYRLFLISIHSSEMPTHEIRRRETYCTNCKQNVAIIDATYLSLANGRAIIRGKCSRCGLELIKASIMPKSSALTFRKKGKRVKRSFQIL
jgi:Domain of unknown function (DUF5679)